MMDCKCALIRLWPTLLPGLFVGVGGSISAHAQENLKAEPELSRIVHHFDFDERAAGNLEDIPKYWLPFRPPRFPQFTYGGFDFKFGRNAPPSFHLGCNGRSVAYHYTGPETRVRANSAYRIEAFIHPDRLKHARACLSAHFLDRHGYPILDTLVRSRYLGNPSEPTGWSRVELYLPAAPPEAATVALTAWVLQKSTWGSGMSSRRHIPHVDVHAGAWFDDITIHTVPRMNISTAAPGNVFTPDGPQELHIVLADHADIGLEGHLTVTAADGTPVKQRDIPVMTGGLVEASVIPVDHLPPGWYHAQLEVRADEVVIASRRLAFAKLASLHRAGGANARPFGVVVGPHGRSDVDTELALLRHQAARSVKLPVWTGLPEDPPTPAQERATDHLLQELVKDGFALTGVFLGPPSAIVRSDGPHPPPLLELLSGPPEVWREHLAAVAAPYAGMFRWWQIGPDAPAGPVDRKQLNVAVAQLREAMRRFITLPRLALPASDFVQPHPDKLPVEQVAVNLGGETSPAWFPAQLDRFRQLGYDQLSVYVEPLPARSYRRPARLADWARRIIRARFAGADTVFVPQTWHLRETAHGKVTEPAEEYVILRTIAEILADALPGHRIRVAPAVECLAFDHGDSAIVAAWDPYAPPEGRPYAIQLGPADRQIDLRGRSTPLPRDQHGRQIVRLSPTPTLIPRVEPWLIDLRTSVALRPGHIESGTELARHTIELTHQGARPISGSMTLDVPESWEVAPRHLSFNLIPQRPERFDVEINYPHNEVAGSRDIVAQISITGESYYLEVPLAVEVGLKDVEVAGMAVLEGPDLVVQHVVTNRSDSVMHFRGAAQVPGRERQYRPFSNLRPGDTQTTEYRFADARDLAGSRVRVGLREMNDGPRTHTLELLIP